MNEVILEWTAARELVVRLHSPTQPSHSRYDCYLLTISVALVCERTIPTEQPSLVGEVSATFVDREVSHGQ
jgi:hypothetical protein